MRALAIRRVFGAVAGEHVLQDHLLLQHLRFRGGDVLLAAGHFGLRLHDFDGRDGAKFGAALVVFVQLLVQLERRCFTLSASLNDTRS